VLSVDGLLGVPYTSFFLEPSELVEPLGDAFGASGSGRR
jgi:hypothetical protein